MFRSRAVQTACLPVATLVAALAGCAAKPGHVTAPPGDPAPLVAATDERSQAAEAALVLGPVAPPPGIDPAVLEPRPPSDPRARMPLHDALRDASSSFTARGTPAPEPPATDDAHEALLLYVAAWDELLQGKALAAVTRLERAKELDPTSPDILRALAQGYVAVQNPARVVSTYERLVELAPDDSEALLTLGLAAVNRGDDARAVARLAAPRLAGRRFDHDPAADVLADFALHVTLERLGYDTAAIELGRAAAEVSFPRDEPTAYRARLASLYRQRGQIWRAVGDAHCRLGAYESAIHAYEAAARLPLADDAALAGRMVYANLKAGHARRAGAALIGALAAAAPGVTDRHVRLCTYLAASISDHRWVTEGVLELQRDHPDAPGLVRAAAVLLPSDEANRYLRAFVRRRPRAVGGVGELLAWLGVRDAQAAIDLTATLCSEEIDLASSYVRRLLRALPSAAPLIDAEASPASAGHAQVRAIALLQLGAPARAWAECVRALGRWPQDDALRLLRIEMAGRLDEPPLLDEAIAAATDLTGAWAWLVRAAAYRELEDNDAALAAATRACDASDAEDAHRMEARLELARVHIERGLVMDIDPERISVFDDVIGAVEEARQIAPDREEPYELLTLLVGTGGPLADAFKLRQVTTQLRRRIPNGRLTARLEIAESMGRRRFDEALERARALVDADRSDAAALALAMEVWKRADRPDDGEAWLRGLLEPPTADPTVLDQLVRYMLSRERAEPARALLEQRLASAPGDPAAERLLEMVCRVAGPADEAMRLAETRLLRRPEGTRRALQLALVYVQAGAPEAALGQLEWIAAHANAATGRHLAGAIGLSSSMEALPDRRDEVTARLVERAARVDPGASMSVYAAGLLALARDGGVTGRFNGLVASAATESRSARDGTITGVLPWRDLAQRLIDLGNPRAAAAALRARLDAVLEEGYALEPGAFGLLVSMILTVDAAATTEARETAELLHDLAERDMTPALPGMAGEPSLAAAFAAAGQLFGLVGNDAGAESLLAEAVVLDPGDAMSLNNLGYHRLVAGRVDDEVRAMIERAATMQPNEASITDTKAWLLYKDGLFEAKDGRLGAVDELERAIGLLDEPSAEVLDHLGDARWRTGRREDAAAAWRQAAVLLEDSERKEQLVRNYMLIQSQVWGLVVADPEAMYHRDFGAVLERVRRKLSAANEGGEPPVAPTLDELSRTE